MPSNIKYIGNSSDDKCPFGPFCDLRIYKGIKKESFIKNIYRYYEPKQEAERKIIDIHNKIITILNDSLISYVMITDYISEEAILYLTKFINALLTKNDIRYKYLNFNLVVKISKEGLGYKNMDNIKEVAKFLRAIS